MSLFVHIVIFILSLGTLWFFAGRVVYSVDRIARRFRQSGFLVAFFILGFITSLGEISVGVNAVFNGVPEISAGNVVGASFVLLLFVVPLLAVIGNGVKMHHLFGRWRLLFVLVLIALPAFFFIDGTVTLYEGSVGILLYGILIYSMRNETSAYSVQSIDSDISEPRRYVPAKELLDIAVSGVLVFGAGYMLVTETLYFGELLSVPAVIVSILVLSLGTNIPELTIAVRAVIQKRSDVALGNYIGSSVMNTVIFSILPLAGGTFSVDFSDFALTFWFIIGGFIMFYIFVRSKDKLSRFEGSILLLVYIAFLVTQIHLLA